MAMVYIICGKLCSGKSTYAKQLCQVHGAVLLSVDEIMLALFGQYAGDRHDEYTASIKAYLYEKSAEIAESGISVVLDWGFWTKAERTFAWSYYSERNISCEFHYMDISDAVWQRRIAERNRLVAAGAVDAYAVDKNLAQKFDRMFEPPERSEIDVWITV